MYNAITDVPGIKVGHYSDRAAATGCTVVLCEQGVLAGVDVRGSAPGTRETDSLRPMSLIHQVHAIVLSGGSAFGLDAASGVMRYLEERGYGLDARVARVPIVSAAILFDLSIGDPKMRPGAAEGYQACLAATNEMVAEGSIGAGTGATVGKIFGPERATKAGLGTASQKIGEDIVVGAIVAVNAFGDVVDPETGEVIAGPRQEDGKGFLRTTELLSSGVRGWLSAPTNTVIGVVATNARLDRDQVSKLAQLAHDGLARTIQPAHTMADGDVFFALATGQGKQEEMITLGSVAVEVVATAVMRSVTQAEAVCGIPAAREVLGSRR